MTMWTFRITDENGRFGVEARPPWPEGRFELITTWGSKENAELTIEYFQKALNGGRDRNG